MKSDSDIEGISIILPVYNAERTLGRCLDSLLHQTYENFEILAINDGSKDDSLKILLKYADKDPRIKVTSKHNEGVSATRNKGLRLATRKWVTFCDADDEVLPRWLETMAENMHDLDFVATGIQFVENDGTAYENTPKHLFTKNATSPATLIDELILSKVFGYTFCKLFKRDIILNHNIVFDTRISFREDELWCVAYFEHMRSWTTVPYAGYRYYLPEPKKSYKGSFTDFITPIFNIYHRIFPITLTPTISSFYYKIMRNMLAYSVINNNNPTRDQIEHFSMVLGAYSEKRSLGSKCVDYLLSHNHIFSPITRVLLKTKHSW